MLPRQMAITIRNEALEQRIRALAKRTGETPTALIARLSLEELKRLETEDLKSNRVAAMNRLRAILPKLTDEDRRAIDHAMHDLYDERGLPK